MVYESLICIQEKLNPREKSCSSDKEKLLSDAPSNLQIKSPVFVKCSYKL